MFAYAVTLICAVFPCTYIIDPTQSFQYTYEFNVPYQSVIPIEPIDNPNVPYPQNPFTSKDLSGQIVSEESLEKSRPFSTVSPVNSGVDRIVEIPSQDAPHAFIPIQQPNSMEFNKIPEESENPVVQIKDGNLKGFIMKTVSGRRIAAFQSVPYAESPIGLNRFKAPEKISPWKGTRDAIAESPTCIQADFFQQYKIHGQEDCLYLNVYTPQLPKQNEVRKKGLPVMVWIHGGGWFFSTSALYGPHFLLDQEVVMVSMNYRLSMFGFLSTGDEAAYGNYGLMDQILALNWVKDNIAAFGGDPSRVTIAGESAGASSVHFHMVSPLAKGLFHRAISQSGCATCFWSISEKAADITRKYASLLNCTGTSEQMISCLRGKDAQQLVGTQLALLEWTIYPVVIFGPVIEIPHIGSYIEELPETIYRKKQAANVPWITGFNADEGGVNIAILFGNNQSVSQINNEWDKYGPILLELKGSGDKAVELANEVRQHYLGKEMIRYENRHKAVKMFSDRYSVACGAKAINLHNAFTDQPVYAYYLSYRGNYSVVQALSQNPKDWGVSHIDDLIYLFNNSAYYPTVKLEDEEYKMSRLMTSLWANFAASGKPQLDWTVHPSARNIWNPVSKKLEFDSSSPVEYFDLTLSPKMIQDPFHERNEYWKSLRLKD